MTVRQSLLDEAPDELEHGVGDLGRSRDSAFAAGEIDETTYAALLYAAATVFYECVVERFTEQPGVYAGTRTNVGELTKPINGCSWINDPRIRAKLTPNLWR